MFERLRLEKGCSICGEVEVKPIGVVKDRTDDNVIIVKCVNCQKIRKDALSAHALVNAYNDLKSKMDSMKLQLRIKEREIREHLAVVNMYRKDWGR